LPPGGGPLSVAAFGDRAIAVAARYADRMLLDLVGPGQVRGFRERLDRASADAGRTPRLAACRQPSCRGLLGDPGASGVGGRLGRLGRTVR
jgi:alkanesulfonate monooxygenase SsuD/methylene tetrahydromethanopterin reductase-like flavin-dependent oxidoreductase (luciferase family)